MALPLHSATTTFLLSLEGRPAGSLLGAENSNAGERVVPGGLKHVSLLPAPQWTLQCGAGMSHDLYRWIGEALRMQPGRRNLQITAVDALRKPRMTWDLFNALLTEVSFPGLGTVSHGRAALIVTVQAERMRVAQPGDDAKATAAYAPAKPWPTTRFRLSIDGLGNAADLITITRISAYSLKFGTKALYVGEDRSPQLEPTKLDDSTLSLTVPERNSGAFLAWFEKTVAAKHTPSNEKSGQLQYLAGSQTLPTLKFRRLGIISVKKQPRGDEVNVELYVAGVDIA